MSRAERVLHGQVTSLYASYLQRDLRFEDRNLRALSGRVCPVPDHAFLRRLIDFGLVKGYLRAPAQRMSG